MAIAESVEVDLDTYAVVETNRQMTITQTYAGGVNTFDHKREVPGVDNQPVIRMNRDTLYSMAIVDASKGATVTLPDAGDRYISQMYLDENHRVYDMVHEPGEQEIPAHTDHRYALVRVGFETRDAADLEEIHRIQDAIELSANGATPVAPIEFDKASYKETHHGILDSFAQSGLLDTENMCGNGEYVDHDKYIMGTATGWGGATWKESIYQFSGFFGGETYSSTTIDDSKNEGGFWSIAVYDRDGFLFDDVANINSLVAEANDEPPDPVAQDAWTLARDTCGSQICAPDTQLASESNPFTSGHQPPRDCRVPDPVALLVSGRYCTLSKRRAAYGATRSGRIART